MNIENPEGATEAPADPRPEWWTPEHEQAAAEGWAENPANPDNAKSNTSQGEKLINAIRSAAISAQAMEIRERFVAGVLESIAPLDAEYADGEEIDRDVSLVARYVTGLADALGQYVVTGEVTALPNDAGTIDGE